MSLFGTEGRGRVSQSLRHQHHASLAFSARSERRLGPGAAVTPHHSHTGPPASQVPLRPAGPAAAHPAKLSFRLCLRKPPPPERPGAAGPPPNASFGVTLLFRVCPHATVSSAKATTPAGPVEEGEGGLSAASGSGNGRAAPVARPSGTQRSPRPAAPDPAPTRLGHGWRGTGLSSRGRRGRGETPDPAGAAAGKLLGAKTAGDGLGASPSTHRGAQLTHTRSLRRPKTTPSRSPPAASSLPGKGGHLPSHMTACSGADSSFLSFRPRYAPP